MLEQLCSFYTDKLIMLYRYKKNLLSPEDLENEIFKLDCLYSIYGWVKEKDWDRYTQLVWDTIGTYCIQIEDSNPDVVSPDQELEVEWVYCDGSTDPLPPMITTTRPLPTTTVQIPDLPTTTEPYWTTQPLPTTTEEITTTVNQTTVELTTTLPITTTVEIDKLLVDIFGRPLGRFGSGTLLTDVFGVQLGEFDLNQLQNVS